MNDLIKARPGKSIAPSATDAPALVLNAGTSARFAWDEFIYGRLRNPYTRRNYSFACRRFLAWCESRRIELAVITPRNVGEYLDSLDYATATKKLHLSAIRHLFDELVKRHAVMLNPAASVRAERLQVIEGRTPEISVKEARHLLASIDTTNVVGKRDRALIAILIYTATRVGAVARSRHKDFHESAGQHVFRFLEKSGKSREIPARHDLRGYILDYVCAAELEFAQPGTALFRTTIRRTGVLTQNGMTPGDISRMVKRRLHGAGLSSRLSPHSFRVAAITDLLSQTLRRGVPLEDVQHLAGHADPRTTRLYDRRQRRVTRNIVERISI